MSKARDLANAGTALTTVSATELGYLDGVTSAVQTQLNAKQAVVSGVDSTEIGYLDGVTSAIQTQIDSKIGSASAINPTIVDAKGDLIAATAADTVARLAVGTNDQVLTADSSTATGLKWATAASGGETLISTTTLSGSSITLSSIPSTYKSLKFVVRNFRPSADYEPLNVRFNGDSTANRYFGGSSTTNIDGQTFSQAGIYGGGAEQQDSGAAGNALSVTEIYDYTNTTTWKMLTTTSIANNGGTPTWINAQRRIGAYNQTSAISSITLYVDSGTITSGTVLLYGVN